MLLPREQRPWNCGYFLGAAGLMVFRDSGDLKLSLEDLQARMSQVTGREISLAQVVSAAAWLYLLGAVQADENGMISICA